MKIALILLVLAYAVLNCARGRGFINKWVCYALFAVLQVMVAYFSGVALTALDAGILFLIGAAGYTYGYLHCWGKYFPQPLDTSAEVCVQLVDDITTKIYGPYTSTTPIPQALNWKTIAMAWRWMIFFSPLNIGVALFTLYLGAPIPETIFLWIVTVLLLALVGPIYRICFDVCSSNPAWQNYSVASSEVFAGAVLGICACVIT